MDKKKKQKVTTVLHDTEDDCRPLETAAATTMISYSTITTIEDDD